MAARSLAPLAREHSLIITHGNGPQVGLLALEAAAVTRGRAVHPGRAQRRIGGHDRLHDRAGAGQRPSRGSAVRHHPDPGGGRPGRPGIPEPHQAHRAPVLRGRKPSGSPASTAGPSDPTTASIRRLVPSPAATAHLRDAGGRMAGGARSGGHLHRGRRHPDHAHPRRCAHRRRGGHRQGPSPALYSPGRSGPRCS